MPARARPLAWHHALALLLAFFAAAMSALVSRAVFERLPHLEDEVAYLYQAKTLAGGQLVIPIPEPRRAYWQPFVVDYGPSGMRFGKYSPGWPLLLAPGVLAGQPWLVNALCAALTVALVYRLGRELFGPDVGVIAAALTAFSPMALLLNGTLMGHTAALTCAVLFMYALWRVERGRHALRWGLLGGAALGLLVINRPLTAVGLGAPFIAYTGLRLLLAGRGGWGAFGAALRPLLALGALALAVSAAIPLYNYAATGDPAQNLYTLVWPYDRVGFGECCGRSGHTLEKGVRHLRFDLSLLAADLYGWQLGDITPELQEHLRTESGYWPLLGLSWVLLPAGLLVGARRRWTWLLALSAISLVAAHAAYWIGSQRYSTRYYFEALAALSLISALPLAWLVRRSGRRWLVYGALAAALVYSLYAYSTPRINALYGFNEISRATLDAIEARRDGARPALVLVSGPASGDNRVRWRALGALMAVTSPYLDSEIVGAWDTQQPGVRAAILDRFPDRQVIEMRAEGNRAEFADTAGGG